MRVPKTNAYFAPPWGTTPTAKNLKNSKMDTTTQIPDGYKPTNYTFRGEPVYRHDGLYVLATGQFVFRRDLQRKTK